MDVVPRDMRIRREVSGRVVHNKAKLARLLRHGVNGDADHPRQEGIVTGGKRRRKATKSHFLVTLSSSEADGGW
jgi:hypothetical protein